MLLIGTKRVDRSGVILSRALSRRYLGNTIGLPMPEEGSMSAVPARFSPGSGQLCETSAAAALLMFWTALERPDHGFVAGGDGARRGVGGGSRDFGRVEAHDFAAIVDEIDEAAVNGDG